MLSWQQRIDRAKEEVRGWLGKHPRGFTISDKELAHDWMTCSCGMLDSRIPRNLAASEESGMLGCPADDQLAALGVKFYDAVENNEIERAEVLYRKIQVRAEIIIEQVENANAPIEGASI